MVNSYTVQQRVTYFFEPNPADSFELWKEHMDFAARGFEFSHNDLMNQDLDAASVVASRITDEQTKSFAAVAASARREYYSMQPQKARPLYIEALLLWSESAMESDETVSGLISEMSTIEFLHSNLEAAELLSQLSNNIDEAIAGKKNGRYKSKNDSVWFRRARRGSTNPS